MKYLNLLLLLILTYGCAFAQGEKEKQEGKSNFDFDYFNNKFRIPNIQDDGEDVQIRMYYGSERETGVIILNCENNVLTTSSYSFVPNFITPLPKIGKHISICIYR